MTIRISGVILPQHKHIRIALRSIYGVGNHRALQICEKVGLNPAIKVNELKEEQVTLLQAAMNTYEVEGDLRRRISMDIKRLMDNKSYRGIRHKRRLPVRGQRTKTNARTRKGRKRQANAQASK